MTRDSLLSILSAIVHGNDIKVVSDSEWKEVYQFASEQAVVGIAFDKVQKQFQDPSFKIQASLPTEVTLQWYALQQQIEKQNRKVNKVLYAVAKELNEHHINFVLLKGQGLAQLYPNPLSRQSGDIDIFVGTEKYEETKRLFAEKDWMEGGGLHEDIKHLKCSVDGVLIEIHNYPIVLPGSSQNAYCQRCAVESLKTPTTGYFINENGEFDVQGEFVATFHLPLNFVYTFIHAFFHFVSEGLVLRQVMDFSLLLKKMNMEGSAYNNEVKLLLLKTGFMKPWQVFGCLLVKYLGFSVSEVPFYDAKYEKKADRVMEIIIEEGHKARKREKGLWSEYLRECKCHFRLIGLFPKECFGFLLRLLMNTFTKYAKLGESSRGVARKISQCPRCANSCSGKRQSRAVPIII